MILVLLANGFEEIEALTPVDMLRRAGLNVNTVGIDEKTVTGAHGIGIVCDMLCDEVIFDEVEMVIFPGGMPGTLNLDASPFTDIAIKAMLDKNGRIAAICAAPLILGKRGMLDGKRATCYPGFEDSLIGATLSDSFVVTDGNITTARGMGCAIEFAEELIGLLVGKDEAKKISSAICKPSSAESTTNETESKTVLTEACPINKEYIYPSTKILSDYEAAVCESDEQISDIINTVNKTLTSFGISAKIDKSIIGPRTISIEITPAKGVRVSSILKLVDDIQLDLGYGSIRAVAPFPGESVIILEIPRTKYNLIGLRPLLESEEFKNAGSKTTVCFGCDHNGKPIIEDLARMPHLFVGGATGMGKSVLMNAIITSLMYKATPDEVKLVLIDPKEVEFYNYKDIPHLLHPIVTEPRRAAAILQWAIDEVDRRYSIFQAASVRNIETYNEKLAASPDCCKQMAKIVIVIDELSDLMLQAKELIEENIVRISQKARAAGIYLVIATQRPRQDVFTGIIKANIPSRICLKVMSQIDSQTILDVAGGEKLLDRGDALYSKIGYAKPIRMQSAFISDSEVVKIVDDITKNNNTAIYDKEIIALIEKIEAGFNRSNAKESRGDALDVMDLDPRFIQAVELAISHKKVSTSIIQRFLSIGYGKAAMFIDLMESMGIVGPMQGQKPRDVLITMDEWLRMIGEK